MLQLNIFFFPFFPFSCTSALFGENKGKHNTVRAQGEKRFLPVSFYIHADKSHMPLWPPVVHLQPAMKSENPIMARSGCEYRPVNITQKASAI